MLELHVCDRHGTLLRSYAIGDTAECIIGRDDTCDIRIVSPSISREHCCIEQTDNDIVIRDLDSTGGTFVNGHRVESMRIHDGLAVTIGPAVLKFSATEIE